MVHGVHGLLTADGKLAPVETKVRRSLFIGSWKLDFSGGVDIQPNIIIIPNTVREINHHDANT